MPKVIHTYLDEATDKVVESDESTIECDVLQCESGARMKGDELPEDWTIVPTKKGDQLYLCPGCGFHYSPAWMKGP